MAVLVVPQQACCACVLKQAHTDWPCIASHAHPSRIAPATENAPERNKLRPRGTLARATASGSNTPRLAFFASEGAAQPAQPASSSSSADVIAAFAAAICAIDLSKFVRRSVQRSMSLAHEILLARYVYMGGQQQQSSSSNAAESSDY